MGHVLAKPLPQLLELLHLIAYGGNDGTQVGDEGVEVAGKLAQFIL